MHILNPFHMFFKLILQKVVIIYSPTSKIISHTLILYDMPKNNQENIINKYHK